MTVCKPRFQNYFYLSYYPNMGLIFDSLMFVKNPIKVAWKDWHIFLVAAKV